MSKFEQKNYSNNKEILKFNNQTAIGVMVSDDGIQAVNGKKIVPAGTILGGKLNKALTTPNEVVIKKNTIDAEGVLLSDVDVTFGPSSGAMVIFGFIDLTKLPEEPSADAKKALNMIKFLK